MKWKTVPGYRGLYKISEIGVIKNSRGQVLKQSLDTGGYVRVTLTKEGKRKTIRIHRLVLNTFNGTCPPGMVGCHNDSNKLNNSINNLRLAEGLGVEETPTLKFFYKSKEIGQIVGFKKLETATEEIKKIVKESGCCKD